MITHRRIARASLESPVDDGGNRNNMPMQTLIGIDADPPNYKWLLEASWDGEKIGDIQIFLNENAPGDGSAPPLDGDGKPIDPQWVWWAGVPCGKVNAYRFAGGQAITPNTVEEATPSELPKSDAERETKPRSPGEGSRRRGPGEDRV